MSARTPATPAKPAPRRRRLRAPARREQILQVSVRVFAEHGYNASMADVAEAAGITRTVLYYYFPSKSDLFLSVLEAQVTALLEYLAPVIGGKGTQRQRLRATLNAGLRFAEESPQAWKLLFGHLDDVTEPELREAFYRAHEGAVAAGQLLLASDVNSVGVDPNSVRGYVMAEMIFGSLLAVTRWWAANPSVDREEVADAMVELLWHGMAGLRRKRR